MMRAPALLMLVGAAALALTPPAARAGDIDSLLEELARPDQERWQRVERQIVTEWSRSGSAALDLLLRRGRDALEAGEMEEAVEHLTALLDHAPDFAEGYHARAQAYFMRGDHGPALDDLAQALALNPVHFGAMAGLAAILEETGNERGALEVYRRAVAVHPHQPALKRAIERLEPRVGGRDA